MFPCKKCKDPRSEPSLCSHPWLKIEGRGGARGRRERRRPRRRRGAWRGRWRGGPALRPAGSGAAAPLNPGLGASSPPFSHVGCASSAREEGCPDPSLTCRRAVSRLDCKWCLRGRPSTVCLDRMQMTRTWSPLTQTPNLAQEGFRTTAAHQAEGARASQTLGKSFAANSCDPEWI